jgi:hypothetical protein
VSDESDTLPPLGAVLAASLGGAAMLASSDDRRDSRPRVFLVGVAAALCGYDDLRIRTSSAVNRSVPATPCPGNLGQISRTPAIRPTSWSKVV